MSRRFLWIGAFLIPPTACRLFQASLRSPDKGGATWREITSEHFVLCTDLESDEARRLAGEFETYRDALIKVAFPTGGAAEPRVAIVLLKRSVDYDALAPFGTDGFATPHLPLDLERHPVAVILSDALSRARHRFVHEEFHELMHRAYGNSPPWLNEGLAGYFSTLRLENGTVFLGDAVPELTTLPLSLVPSVTQIVHAERAAFTPVLYSKTSVRLYEGAWLLVHFLRNGPEGYRRRFVDFVDGLNALHSADEAWRTAMAGLPEGRLEHDFRVHIAAWSLPIRSETIAPLFAPVDLAERLMTPAEVHILWARLAVKDPRDRFLASREIDEAAALEPWSADVAYARGCLAMAERQTSLAAAAFRGGLSMVRADPRLLYGLALSTGDCGASSTPPKDKDVCESLVVSASSPEENSLAARYLRVTDRGAEALDRAEKAFDADHRCEPCAETLADLLAANGNVAAAIAVLERALSISAESFLDRRMATSLERYRMMANQRSER